MSLSWRAALCERCWEREYPGVSPVRLKQPDWEQCALCGEGTMSGIYVRLDPAEQSYPKEKA